MDYRFKLLIPLILAFLSLSQAKRSFTIEYNNFTCRTLDPTMAHEFTCILHRKRISPSLSVRFNLKKQVNDFKLLFDFSILRKDNNNMNVGRHKIEGCKFLSSLSGSSIFSKIFSHLQAVSNIPKKCPIPANKLFEIRNYTIQYSDYPVVVPAVSHEFILQLEYEKKIIGDLYLAGSVSY